MARQIVGDTLAAILHQFLLGFQTGLESAPSKQTEGLWDRVDNISFMDIYDFGSGFSTGIDKGLRRSFKELVDMVLNLLKLPQLLGDFLNRLSELAARYKLKLSQLKAKGGGLSERLNRLDDAFARDPHALERLLDAVSSFALAKVREGGIDAAGQLLKYLEKPWDKIGEDFGDIAGQILFQVLLAVGTDLIGNLVEEAIALTGRLAALAARAAEGVVAAMRTVEGLIGEAIKWVEKVGGQLAGEAGELFEAIKAVLSDMRVIFADIANEGALADTGVGVKLPVPEAKGATVLESGAVKPPLGTPPKTVADLPPTSTGTSSAPTVTGGATAPVPPMGAAEFNRLPYAERQKLLDEWMEQRGVKRLIDWNDHHAWPMYLGGPKNGPLIPLDEQLHRAFHSVLNKSLPENPLPGVMRGTDYYAGLSEAQKAANIKKLKVVVRDFDKQWGTKIGDQLAKALQGTDYADVPVAP